MQFSWQNAKSRLIPEEIFQLHEHERIQYMILFSTQLLSWTRQYQTRYIIYV